MSAGECQTKNRNEYDKEEEEKIVALDEGRTTLHVVHAAGSSAASLPSLNSSSSLPSVTSSLHEFHAGDIALLKTYGVGPYSNAIKTIEDDIKKHQEKVKELIGIKESDTGLSLPSQWDLVSDKQMMQEEQPLQVARCTKIINPNAEDTKYVINIRQIAKFVVGLGEKVSPTDIDEGMRVGVDRTKYAIQIPLPPKIDPTVSLMEVEDKPDVTYDDVGGSKKALEELREVVEIPLLHPERFVTLGIDPPKGVLLYGPPGTGKTLSARAVANRTDATFIRVIGSELVQRYVGEGARMVRELFSLARSRKMCIIFFDEVDAIGGSRSSGGDEGNSDNEVQRTMLQIVTELDGFDARGNIKVLMATNRPDTLDPALLRPGRLDRKVEFGLPDLEGRTHILKIHAKVMSVDRDIRYELLARLCPNTTGAELRSVCTEAGMFAIRARRKSVSEKDFLDSINKVIKGYQKFSSTPKYMVYN
jgi:26S proteasome regulatory subunit T1